MDLMKIADPDIVVMCKTCGYETSVAGWIKGKRKYQCDCWVERIA